MIKTTTVVHAPTGPVWLTAGSVVPEDVVELVRDELLIHSSEPTPTSDEAQGGTVGDDAGPTSESSHDESESPSDSTEDDGTTEPGKAQGVPYANYPLEQWTQYAASLGIDVTGMKKAQIIGAVAEHFNVAVEGLSPAKIVDKIREAAI